MNPLPPNADELVSAYLDGQAAPDEIAIVESSPELMERVETLRSVSNLLGTPVTAPPEQKEAHISAALDAFDALFAADSATDQIEPPSLAAVPDSPAVEEPPRTSSPAVTSLQAARERRRRFSPGIIAAAVATVLLFVALAAFGLGGNSSDVATSAAADAGDDASASSMADVEESGSALNELQAVPTAAPEAEAEALEVEEAMADEEAMDDDEAMADEEAMDDEEDAVAASAPESAGNTDLDADAAAAEAADSQPFAFFAGTFPDQDSLKLELEQFALEELEQRAARIEPGLFPGCQQDIAELQDIETATLIADAFIDDQAVEVHQLVNVDGTITFIIVDASECTILPSAP